MPTIDGGSYGGSNTWATNTTLNVSGPTAAELTLVMLSPLSASGSLDLVVAGPQSAVMPLFIGKDILTGGTGNIPLFLQSPFATGVIAASGGASGQEFLNLAVSGTTLNTSDGFNNANLFISSVSIASGIGTAPLTMVTDPAPTPNDNGTISDSGVITIAVSGANPGSVYTKCENQTSLFIKTHTSGNNTMTLYVDYPLGQIMPLSIKNKSPSGVLDVSISGAYFANENTTLNIRAPFTNTMTLVSSGFDGSGEAPLSI